ncbi:GAF domain-containing protein [bacterium]|nr:GAF domain-containing protein [bacterium]
MKDLKQHFALTFMKIRNLSTTLDPEEIFKGILSILSQEMASDHFILFLYDREKDELFPFKWLGYPDEIKDKLNIPISTEHLLTYAFKIRQQIYREEALNDPETSNLTNREPLRSTILAIPITTGVEALGVIHIESFSDKRASIEAEDLRLFASLGTFMGIALNNANVLLQTREELTSTKQVSERELAEKRQLKEMFSRYASAELVETLIKNPKSVNLGGSTKIATILFSDIAGFTNFSSKLSPEQVVVSINEYLSRMTEVVLNHQGEIDKFIGDAVMARFGVLVDLPSTGIVAVQAALAMLQELWKLQARWLQEQREVFSIRIGIATGPVLAGNIGSERRQEFTVMGTTVNLASRLEALNKDLRTTILIDENTYRQVIGHFQVLPRENVSIRGLEGKITVYEVLGARDNSQNKSKVVSIRGKIATPKSPA